MLNSYTGETTHSENPALIDVIYLQLEILYSVKGWKKLSGTNVNINDHGIFGSELVVADIYASIQQLQFWSFSHSK